MKKRILAIFLLCGLLLPLLAACGGGTESGSASQSESKSESKSESQSESRSESQSEKETEKEKAPDEYDGDAELVIYVDSFAGDDEAEGTEDDPVETVEAAYAKAVAAINAGDAKDVAIWLYRGDHLLSHELKIDGKQITATDYHITFCGNADQDAVLSATSQLDASDFLQFGDEDYYYYQLPESYRDDNGNFPEFRDLYFNGQYMTLAMTDRNEGFLKFDSCARISTESAAAGVKEADHLIWVRPSLLGVQKTDKDGYVLATDPDGELVLDDKYQPIRTKLELWVKTVWQLQCLHVLRVLPQVKTQYFWDAEHGEYLVPVEIDAEQWKGLKGMQSLDNAPYWFANAIDYLDEPGEFFYDRAGGTIYVYPDYLADMDDSIISFATAENAIYLEDAKNITFENLTIYGSTSNFVTENGFLGGQGGNDSRAGGFLPYGMIFGKNVSDITIDNCILTGAGGDTINFRGAVENITISNNRILGSGGAAIRCGTNATPQTATRYNKNIVIQNNYIYDSARVYTLAAAILITSVENLEVSYNTILNCCYSAMSIGWGWTRADSWAGGASRDTNPSNVNVKNAEIAYNYIENYMMNMRDGGAIYTLNANENKTYTGRLNTIHDNYIVTNNNVGNYNTGFWGIVYHDGGSSHWDDHDNVFILPEEDVIPPCSFVYYQPNVDNQRNFCNDTTNLYIVGYPQDHKSSDTFPAEYDDATNETPVGWYIALGKKSGSYRDGYSFTQDPVTGAYTFDCDYFHTYSLTAKDIYLYDSFDDEEMTDDAFNAINAIYEESGCNLDGCDKPTAAGEMAHTWTRGHETYDEE